MKPNVGLILASSSPHRRMLLDRLQLAYDIDKPEIDESARPGESPVALCRRLAREKAETVAARHPGKVVIGSDQLVEADDRTLGKPGSHEGAVEQLRFLTGKQVHFHVAVTVIDAAGHHHDESEVVTAKIRDLDDAEIEAYLRHEQPYNCAGSMRSEGLGITLLESMTSTDPTAIIGLPLIATARLLRQAGVRLYQETR